MAEVMETPRIYAETSEDRSSPERWWPYLLLLAAAAIVVYANSLWNGFAYDDDWIILRNDRVHQLRDLAKIWGTPYWPTFGTVLGLYRPLTIFAYALQWAAADGAPWVFHAVNVALHATATTLVFALLAQFTSARAALIGALLFALHPVHTEAVANVVGQAELLAAVTTLAACVIYARRRTDAAHIGLRTIAVITLLYALGLLSKEASVTLPGLLVLLDIAQGRVKLNRAGIIAYVRQVWLLLFVLAATVVFYLSIRVGVLGSISGSDAGPGLPFLREEHRLLTALRAWPEFIRLLFFPLDLSADYSPAVILPVESLSPMPIIGAVLLLATIALALFTPVRPAVGFPAAWFLITILTVSNLLFPVGVVVAERTLYTPSLAISAIAAFLFQAYWPTLAANRRRVGIAGLVIVCGLMSWRTITRNPTWKSTHAVMTTLVREHPESYKSAWVLADQFFRRGDLDQSAFYWEAAYLLWNRDSQLLSEFANFNIARRNWARAIELLEVSREMHPWVPRTYEYLSFSYLHAGRPRDAIAAANEGIRLDGFRGSLLPVKARAYEELGNYGLAVGAWRAAIASQRSPLWVYRAMLARSLARNSQSAQALATVDSLQTAIASDTLAVRTTAELRAAIQRGCFEAEAPSGCIDPLADWAIALAPPPDAKQNANSQNATPGTP